MRYTRMPRNGTTMTNSTQRVLATPPRSRLRNRSPKIQNKHMNQANQRKNSNRASRNDPLLLNMCAPLSSIGGYLPAQGPAQGDRRLIGGLGLRPLRMRPTSP